MALRAFRWIRRRCMQRAWKITVADKRVAEMNNEELETALIAMWREEEHHRRVLLKGIARRRRRRVPLRSEPSSCD
jgi:hypothetical protein